MNTHGTHLRKYSEMGVGGRIPKYQFFKVENKNIVKTK